MNAIDRWKIADRLTERARFDNMMLVTEAIDECVKIVDEIVRKPYGLQEPGDKFSFADASRALGKSRKA